MSAPLPRPVRPPATSGQPIGRLALRVEIDVLEVLLGPGDAVAGIVGDLGSLLRGGTAGVRGLRVDGCGELRIL